MRAIALRYALAPACILLAGLLHLSPVGAALHPTGLFTIAVVAAAWFGGAGPGFLAAVLATFTLPQLIAMSYSLVGGVFDLPRFVTFSVAGLAVGWWSFRRGQVDAALRESEKRFRGLTELSADFFWETDAANRCTAIEFGPAYRGSRALGAKVGTIRWEVAPASPGAAEWSAHRADIAAHRRFVGYGFSRIEDGEERFYEESGEPRFGLQGEFLGYRGMGRDVTERKRVEEALRNSAQRYALAMEAAGDGHTDWDLVTGKFYISPRLLELVGHPPDARFADRADWVQRFPFHPEDRPKWEAAVAAHYASRESHFKMQLRIVVRGEVRWTAFHFLSTRDAAGKPIRWTGSIGDITEQKRIEEALRESEGRFARAVAGSYVGVWDIDFVGRTGYFSPRTRELSGLPPGPEVVSYEGFVDALPLHPEDRPRRTAAVEAHFSGKAPAYDGEFRVLQPDGVYRWRHLHGVCVRDAGGKPLRMAGSITDVDARRRAEDALRESDARYERVVAAAEAGFWDWDMVRDNYYVSPKLIEMAGLPPGTVIARREDFQALVPLHPEDMEKWKRATRDLIEGGDSRLSMVVRMMLPGGMRWYRADGMCFRDAEGKVVRWTGSAIDVTEAKLGEEALRKSEQRYELAMAASESGYWDWDIPTGRYMVSPRAYELAGFPPGTTWATRDDYRAHINMHPEDLAKWEAAREALFAGTGERLAMEVRYMIKGESRWHALNAICKRDDSGKVIRWTGSATDITRRRLAEEEVRLSEARFRALTELSADWYWKQDENLRFTYLSSQADSLTGYSSESSLGKTRWEIENMEPLSCSWAEHQAVLAERQPFRDLECRRVGLDGVVRYLSMSGAPIFDHQGRFKGYQGIGRNITERKRAEEDLARLERQLRQAQRLEAMGTLAGGIAHDFNNILGAILGFGEMAQRDAPKESRLARDLDSIMVAGERGRALVDRVLAFSRSAVGERVPVHVERVVREALDLVSAKLPPSVTLHAKLHARAAAVLGDATQVHQVVANLVTNAIQAMPSGGTLRVGLAIERVDAPRAATIGARAAAEYVVLTVADTGVGIAPEIVDRIFDPFFTTKEVGTGTGLGLSLVHGIVTELGGAIDVSSTPGAGATFTVYLPRSGDAAERSDEKESALPRGDGQRVLIVDDEEPLVELATRTLEDLGYAPAGFTSSAAALEAFRADPEGFDALITDERMPGMSGAALIREVRGMRSALPVVLMSGYLGTTVGEADEVLQKPLSARDLAKSLARVLRAQRSASRSSPARSRSGTSRPSPAGRDGRARRARG